MKSFPVIVGRRENQSNVPKRLPYFVDDDFVFSVPHLPPFPFHFIVQYWGSHLAVKVKSLFQVHIVVEVSLICFSVLEE